MTDWLQALHKAGHKVTPARRVIVEAIDAEGAHLAPARILARGKARYPDLGRATVYRTLELFVQMGLLRPIYVGEDGPTYIRMEGGHHHLVCSRCGLIVDFDRCVAEEMVADLCERYGFAISSHLLEFYGLCRECRGSEAVPGAA